MTSRAAKPAVRWVAVAACVCVSAATAARSAPATPASRPNVVLIYTDDHDLDEVGCYGGKVLSPRMDGLARDGMRFTRFYVASAVCSPSRFNTLSGRYASRSLRFQKTCPTNGPANIGWETGVLGEANTLAAVLHAGGYVTGMVGKWHQGTPRPPPKFDAAADPADPQVKAKLKAGYDMLLEAIRSTGFDYAASAYHGNVDDGGGQPGKPGLLPGALRVHNMEWVTKGALDFVRENRGRPFFLYMAPTLVHGPSPTVSLRKADPRATTAGFLDEAPKVQPARADVLARVQKAGIDPKQAGVTWLDDGIGSVLDELDRLGLATNTLVIVAGDNGNVAKFTCYDGGARMPMLIRWPGRVPPGTVCDKLVSNVDFAPTLLEVCGVTAPAEARWDGRSFAGALRNDGSYRRESLLLEITTERAVVTDDGWKYIAVRYTPEVLAQIAQGKKFNHWCRPAELNDHTYDADRNYPGYFDGDQLYDLAADPQEQKNLAADPAQKARLERMKRLLGGYSAELPHPFGEFGGKR